LFSIIRPARVYYLNSSLCPDIIRQKRHFKRLNTDLSVKIFEDSLLKSFEYTNSEELKNSHDYQLCGKLLKFLLNDPPVNELETALKRLFHRDLYNNKRKNMLIDYVLRKHHNCKISIIDFARDEFFHSQVSLKQNRPLRYLEAVFVFFRKLLLKAFSAAYFLKILKPFNIRLKSTKKKLDILLNITCPRQKLLLDLYEELAKRPVSIGFFSMEKNLCDEYKKDALTCFHTGSMACSYKLLYRILTTFFEFYVKAIRLKNIGIFKNVFVFMEKYLAYVCIFENIQCRKIITSEDYSEFNPRHFAAKRTGCEIINILTSKIVPLLNPYLSFCLIDRDD
jgi:hypothetical protein